MNTSGLDPLYEKKRKLMYELPHLYSFKFYKWAREFFESRRRINLLVAANQISKSSTQIRKCIHWATCPPLWPELWRLQPRQFWYLYPTYDVSDLEVHKKWVPEFMPRGDMKESPQYGWKLNKKDGHVHSIDFNTGVSIIFKTYAQNVHNLQSGTVSAIFGDEELPVDYFDELMLRLAATDGYFHLVFTATRGQEFWRRAMECIGRPEEVLKRAWKRQVSMYDCLVYEDGTETPWSVSKIEEIEESCKSEAEVNRRVKGKFVKDEGLQFPTFVRSQNVIEATQIDPDWLIYSGVDLGSGGTKGHPAAITFVAVKPDFTKGIVFRGWRGDGLVTTSSDILMKYRRLRGDLKPILEQYDWHNKDFETYALRIGETFTKADKTRDFGIDLINDLFKNGMLLLFDIPELYPLMVELETLEIGKDKSKARDDFIDSMRYAVARVPWDFSKVTKPIPDPKSRREIEQENYFAMTETQRRRRWVMEKGEIDEWDLTREIEEYNEFLLQ
jgi:hypothetical protein